MSFYNYAPPPSGRGTAYWAGLVAAAVMLLGLVGLAGRVVSGEDVQPEPDATPTAGQPSDSPGGEPSGPTSTGTASANPDPTATTGPAPSGPTGALGESLEGAGFTVTALRAEKIQAPGSRRPGSGQAWVGIRAEVCAAAGASADDLAWSTAWQAVTSGGATFAGADVEFDDFPPQQLPTRAPATGECSVGWVLVSVPKADAKDVASVVFGPASEKPLTWTLG